MKKPIERIAGKIPQTNRDVLIEINGKNLIIVGGNGSGKTSLLRQIFEKIRFNIIQESAVQIEAQEKTLVNWRKRSTEPSLSEEERFQAKKFAEHIEKWLDQALGSLSITFNNPARFIELKQKKLGIFRIFEADRKANISIVESVKGIDSTIDSLNLEANVGVGLEQHLVNLKVRAALAAYKKGTSEKTDQIDAWFEHFKDNIRLLFENESTTLLFDDEKLRFKICQDGRPPFSFQTLSSGYSSIFDIYADLLMRTEYFEVTPAELEGAVLIDEIDAHLHVSLQRKIFPFLLRSFPKVQFIITTHSPFVLTSVEDVLIYDITKNSISTDLSMYSFEAVVEGLLGVPPVSTQLEEAIKQLASTTQSNPIDVNQAESIIKRISPYVDHLDPESEMFYQIAVNKIINEKNKKQNV